VAEEALGDGNLLNGLRIRNTVTKEESTLQVNGLFYAIGHVPNTGFLKGHIELDEDVRPLTWQGGEDQALKERVCSFRVVLRFRQGYVKVKPGTTYTNVEGVFACGDVQDKVYRQAITAAGSGCMAALDCERWLEAHL